MQPTPYTRATAFAEDESSNVGGRSTVRTARVDAELDAIALTLDETLANLELIQRDDGKLRDATVELHTLSSAVLALMAAYGATPRGPWVTATAYAFKDLVSQSTNTYICVTAHTSGTFATDLAAGRWLLFSLGTAIGAGAVTFTPTATIAATDVQAAINESDTENRALSAAAQVTANAAMPSASLTNTASSSLGDALIGVKRTETGAIATTLHSWIEAKPIDAKADFGVAADGATDDTTKLQAAATAASGRKLILPAGTIKTTAAVTLPSTISIEGQGPSTIIKGAGTHDIFVGTYPAVDCRIERLTIDGNKTSGTASVVTGAYFGASTSTPSTKNERVVVECCVIKNVSAGVGIENGHACRVSQNHISAAYRHTSGPYSGNYGYGVVLNGCSRSEVSGNIIGASGALIQRHGVYLPLYRDADVSPTVTVFCTDIRVTDNTVLVENAPGTEPFSSCVESWSFFDTLIANNILVGGVRGINSTPEFQNGSRVQIVGNTIKDCAICIRNDKATLGTSPGTYYFEEWLISGNQLLPLTSVAHQCINIQGVKRVIVNDNFMRGSASSTFAFGYYDTTNNITADAIVAANNTITGFTQGYYLGNVTKFIDTYSVFSNFTGTPTPYARITAISSSEMRPVFAPYTALYAYATSDWTGVEYFEPAVGRTIRYDGSKWVDQRGIRVRGTTAQRPSNVSASSSAASGACLGLGYGFAYYDTDVGALIYWNGVAWSTSQQPAMPLSDTTANLNTFKTSNPNAMASGGMAWNSTTARPVFYDSAGGVWRYADGTAI